jgi:hypothetical protein
MDILNKFNIDPYKYLKVDVGASSSQIKRAYKNLAKRLHPDKNGGKTEAEFKLLHICYKYLLKNCIDEEPSSFEQLKNAQSEQPVIQRERTLYNTNMDDDETRKELFADDDINMKDFENHMKRVQNLSTSYSVENFYKKEILDSMKTKNKFDIQKFNAYFAKLKKDGKIENQLVKKEKVIPSNSDIKYVNVNKFCDRIINSVDKNDSNYRGLMKQRVITNNDMLKVLETDQAVINKIIKENKKNTGKLSRSKLKELELNARSESKKLENLTDRESEYDLLSRQKQQLLEAKNRQKDYVLKHKDIFVNSINYREN